MELASVMKRDSVNVRSTRMRAYAEGEVQREINGAKNRGDEYALVVIPGNIDYDMIQDYIKGFGYSVEDRKDRHLLIAWDDPKK